MPLETGAELHRPVELETVVLDGIKIFDVLQDNAFPVSSGLAPELHVGLTPAGQLGFYNIACLPHFDGRFLHF